MDIRISLIVVTYNRLGELNSLIDSLGNVLKRQDVEMILIDDQSTDGTLEAMTKVLAYMGDRARVIQQPKDGPGMGRNRGIAAARGQILAFVDTDCIAHPEWLEELTAPFDDPRVGAVGGPDRCHPDDPSLTHYIDYLMTSFLTTGGVRGSKKAKGGAYHPRSFNMAVRREAAESVGGFPVIWYGEDILFSWRIQQQGWKLEFAEGAWVYHRRRTSVRGWATQLFRMGRARWWMGRYDRKLLDPIYMLPLMEWLIGIFAVGGLFIDGGPQTASIGVLSLAGIYTLAMGLDAARSTRRAAALVIVPFLFFMREAAYAAGSIQGLRKPLPDMEGALERVART